MTDISKCQGEDGPKKDGDVSLNCDTGYHERCKTQECACGCHLGE